MNPPKILKWAPVTHSLKSNKPEYSTDTNTFPVLLSVLFVKPSWLVFFRGAEYVSAREWMRICFELLELLKAHKKAIRRATVNTFGYIAKAIGWVQQSVKSGYCFHRGVLQVLCLILSLQTSSELLFLSCQPPRRLGHSAQQPEGPRAPEPSLHHRGHRHRGRDLLAVHRAARAHEWIPRARAECAERRAQVPLLPVRIHRRDGQRLHLRRDAAAGGRSHGQVRDLWHGLWSNQNNKHTIVKKL